MFCSAKLININLLDQIDYIFLTGSLLLFKFRDLFLLLGLILSTRFILFILHQRAHFLGLFVYALEAFRPRVVSRR